MNRIQYNQLPDGTHSLVFQEATRSAIDALLLQFAHLYETKGAGESLYIILDFRISGMVPLRYLAHQLRGMLAHHTESSPMYIAMVVADDSVIPITDALLRTIMKRDRIQYFTRVDKAQLWVQLERNKAHNRA